MMVKHDKDNETGVWYREIVFRNYKRLAQLRCEYEAKGFKTWLNLWNSDKNEWLLTIEMGVNYAK